MFRFRFLVALLVPLYLGATDTPLALSIDYPGQDSLFPPDFAPPTFLFRDPSAASSWRVEVTFANHAAPIRLSAAGEHFRTGEIDPRCVSATNKPPTLTAQQAASRTWIPDAKTWATIKRESAGSAAVVKITGVGAAGMALSFGSVTIHTSREPVGAPIFYRDVPLMPSESANGVIKPLAPEAVPLIAWRMRNVSEASSKVLMQDMHTCANCHSFSRDGKTLGMDLDGPQNDKGLYAVVPVKQEMSIGNQDVIAWSQFRGETGSPLREGFMSQVSPDGRFVVTTIAPPGTSDGQVYYVANFTDYRFLQVFYPTRGILAWYDRVSKKLQPLPGADDPRYVQASAVWSPDGKYLVFARAAAREPYPAGATLATSANDPKETPIQYDLYRIPFSDGKGGRAEPIAGAAQNGMSNSFAKVSPDGRWIVFVQAHNGQLMRPDSKLYIVPSSGGEARRMRCNTDLMNSWHSFSPNGRWMVFSSKSRSPYTQMFLTHIDEQGNDTPAILIENSTAANRAVNIPEFVNIAPGGISRIATPAADFYRQFDVAAALAREHRYDEAIPEWKKALRMEPEDARAHNSFGYSLARSGRPAEAAQEYQRAIELEAEYPDAENNLALALVAAGRRDEAISYFRAALKVNPRFAEAHNNLGLALAEKGVSDEAVLEFQAALECRPGYPEAHSNLAVALTQKGLIDEGIEHYRAALASDPDYFDAQNNLGTALAQKGLMDEAIVHFQRAVALKPEVPGTHGNLGRALMAKGRFNEAADELEKAVQLVPAAAALRSMLGYALLRQGRMEPAVSQLQTAADLDPMLDEARFYLGLAMMMKNRPAEAVSRWREALRINPRHVAALNETAWVLATTPDGALRDGAEAVRLASQAVELTHGSEASTLTTLAAGYAESGRFAEAIETQGRATELAAKTGKAQIVESYRARMVEFQAHRALRTR